MSKEEKQHIGHGDHFRAIMNGDSSQEFSMLIFGDSITGAGWLQGYLIEELKIN